MITLQSTLIMMKSITSSKYKNYSLEDLSLAYREGLNPSILASAFIKIHKLIISISQNYYGLNDDDISSLLLEKLDYCLQTFNMENNVKFITYFTVIFKNRLREETQYLNTHKRKANNQVESYNNLLENGFDVADLTEIEYFSLLGIGLSENEEKYCKLIMNQYTNKEISMILNVSVMTLSNMRKKIKEKFIKSGIYSF